MNFSINLKSVFNSTPISEKKPTTDKQGHLMEMKPDVFEKESELKEVDIMYENEGRLLVKRKGFMNPKDKGVIYKKVLNQETGKFEKKPFIVNIAQIKEDNTTTYYFLDPKTNKDIGYFKLDDLRFAKKDFMTKLFSCSDPITRNYSEQGVKGERITIDYVCNKEQDSFAGIGELADQIAIEYCLKNGIKPQIVSFASRDSLIAHYKRGRRFLPLKRIDSLSEYNNFKKQFGTTDPNKVIEEKIKNTPKGEKVDISDIFGLYMYMPQEIVEKYLARIKENPILH